MEEEKTYSFTIAKSFLDVENYELKESELDDKHIDLLVGDFIQGIDINRFKQLPDLVQMKIVNCLLKK